MLKVMTFMTSNFNTAMLYGEATCASSTLLVEAVESSETDYMT
jgi:hypothetical protein